MTCSGSVQEKNGKLYAVISYKDDDGNWKYKWKSTGLPTKGNKKRAEAVVAQLLKEYKSVNEKAIDLTVADYFKQWIIHQEGMVAPTTLRSYKGNMTNHIIPYFEKTKVLLQQLKPKHLEDYYSSKLSSNSLMNGNGVLSTTSIKHHHQAISKALNDAVRNELIQVNPASSARTPKIKKYVCDYLNISQVNELLSLIKGTPIEIPVLLISTYGMRRSECLGLQWKDIDFENKQFTIASAVIQHPGGDYVKSCLKNNSSYRTLPMSDSIIKILKQHKQNQDLNSIIFGNSYIQTDYICTWQDGKLISPNYLTKAFKRMVQKSNLPDVHIHSLRHSVASNLLANGFSVVEVQHFLGHSAASTTLDFYSHVDSSSKRNIMDSLDKKLFL